MKNQPIHSLNQTNKTMNNFITNRFFIVDDDPFFTSLLKQMLEDMGHFNILCFNNGFDSIKYLDLEPGIIFMDFNMQGLNGIETIKRVKSQLPNMSIVLCSACEDVRLAADAIRHGCFDFMLKSQVNPISLSAVISEMKKQTIFPKTASAQITNIS
jgi:DNA-binding NtrC family response regulator